ERTASAAQDLEVALVADEKERAEAELVETGGHCGEGLTGPRGGAAAETDEYRRVTGVEERVDGRVRLVAGGAGPRREAAPGDGRPVGRTLGVVVAGYEHDRALGGHPPLEGDAADRWEPERAADVIHGSVVEDETA